jgi:hypothetical protein
MSARALVLALLGLIGAPRLAGAAGPSAPERPAWSFTPSIYGFIVPDTRDYLNPNLAADRGALHLEGRYNYEAFQAGSAWIGWNFAFGEELTLEIAPMVGGVFGSVDGVAPGWLLSLAYRQFSLSSQGEYLFDASGSAGNFLYTWSELDWSPVEWFRTGIAIQRTKAYETSLDIQRGVLAGFSYRDVELTGYLFNAGWTEPTIVLALLGTF